MWALAHARDSPDRACLHSGRPGDGVRMGAWLGYVYEGTWTRPSDFTSAPAPDRSSHPKSSVSVGNIAVCDTLHSV